MEGGSELADEKTERLRWFHFSFDFLIRGDVGLNFTVEGRVL